jgi:hypothetical protein
MSTPEQHEEAIRSQQNDGGAPPARPESPPSDELRPFKMVGQLIASVHNVEGEIIGERAVAHVEIHQPNFANLPEVAEQTVAAHVETDAQLRQAASEKSG